MQIAIALQEYSWNEKSFPPAYLVDANGKPAHSWRVILLPYLQGGKYRKLFEQYRFDEPWNSPHNSAVGEQMPDLYRCPASNAPHETNYAAVIGEHTAWPGAAASTGKFPDGSSKTIVVVETAGQGIHWLEPRDVSFEDASQGVNARAERGITSSHGDVASVMTGDGCVELLGKEVSPATVRALLTIAGGEVVDDMAVFPERAALHARGEE